MSFGKRTAFFLKDKEPNVENGEKSLFKHKKQKKNSYLFPHRDKKLPNICIFPASGLGVVSGSWEASRCNWKKRTPKTQSKKIPKRRLSRTKTSHFASCFPVLELIEQHPIVTKLEWQNWNYHEHSLELLSGPVDFCFAKVFWCRQVAWLWGAPLAWEWNFVSRSQGGTYVLFNFMA